MVHGTYPGTQDVNDDVIEKIAQRVFELLREDFVQLHGRHDSTAERLTEIGKATGYTQALAQATYNETPQAEGPQPTLPDADTPRPPGIDRACAAATEKRAPQRVDLFEYGMTQYVRPDSDPQQVWDGILATVTAEESEREISRSRRSRGR